MTPPFRSTVALGLFDCAGGALIYGISYEVELGRAWLLTTGTRALTPSLGGVRAFT